MVEEVTEKNFFLESHLRRMKEGRISKVVTEQGTRGKKVIVETQEETD